MKILLAVDGSDYTKRMLAYLAAHDEWFGNQHHYAVIHGVLAVPSRAAAFVSKQTLKGFYDSDAEAVFHPIRAFFAQQGIEAEYTHTVGHVAESIAGLAKVEEGEASIPRQRHRQLFERDPAFMAYPRAQVRHADRLRIGGGGLRRAWLHGCERQSCERHGVSDAGG